MTLAFDPDAALIIVPTRIWGPTGNKLVQLALDTGATASLVSWHALLPLGYDPARAARRVRIATASGVERVDRVVIERVEALGQERSDLRMLCHTMPDYATVDGVLGLDFLRGRRLVIDFRAGLLTLD